MTATSTAGTQRDLPRPSSTRLWVAVAAITMAGLTLRLYRLGTQSFWFDEVQTLEIAKLSWGEIALRAYRPPLYHYLLSAWSSLVPETEFALRLLSALIGAATPLALYLAGRRLFGEAVGLVSAALAAVSPALIWYSQELRMYSLLALEYVVLLWLWTRLESGVSGRSHVAWSAFVAVEVASLYTHYFAIPFLGWLVAIGAARLWAAGRRMSLLSLLASQAAAAVAFVPWLLVVYGGRGGAQDYVAAEVSPVAEAAPRVRDFVLQSWHMYTAGVAVGADYALLRRLSYLAAGLLAVAVATALLNALATRHQAPTGGLLRQAITDNDLLVLGLVVGPWLAAVALFKLRPGTVHPRHIMMVSGPLLLLIARAGTLGLRPTRPSGDQSVSVLRAILCAASSLSLACCLVVLALGQALSYTDAAYLRPDVRSLANYLESVTEPGDLVVSPYRDYALTYYYKGPARTYYVETRVGDNDLGPWFLPLAQGAKHAVLVRWVHSFTDGRDFLPWLFRMNGRLRSQQWIAERRVSVYDLDSPLRLPELSDLSERFDPLVLVGALWPEFCPADQPIPVALEWQAVERAPQDAKVSVRVLDHKGRLVAQSDRVLFSEQTFLPTSRWPQGERAHNYHLVNLPAGTPPLTYTLTVKAYSDAGPLSLRSAEGIVQGIDLALGSFVVTPSPVFDPTYPPQVQMTRLGVAASEGLVLEGVSGLPARIRSGESLQVMLHWRASGEHPRAAGPELQLVSDTGAVLARQAGEAVDGLYPFERWAEGELVCDRREMAIPGEAPTCEATVALAIGGQLIKLGAVHLEHSDRLYRLPPPQHSLDVTLGSSAWLRGYDLSGETLGRTGTMSITLYWESVGTQPPHSDYAVFVHILTPNDQVVTQHDGPPAGGRWPTSGWDVSQIVLDTHILPPSSAAFVGEVVIEVGMYDPKTGNRLRTAAGEDRILLPQRVTLVP